ncbi:hypothetical protein CANARDRAFT_204432 [[Candida] arabinofermentans NRRL YB-2248]|uniref:Sphingoid long-chain base transporter RSB1 n=1 Tax=[Candida] arabinofermentans NRRL YB-2248 TaxID=983967 RepID=A0A1E4STP3_9ASCO|nr:hypothetical protein CANARDRAFT_204432 [[Candida] arabinofermentans NRRL YB-2248]
MEEYATATASSVKESLASQIASSPIANEIIIGDAYYGGNAPNFAGNLALLIVMSIFLIYHFVAGIYYKQWWFMSCWTIFLIMEVVGYIGRCISANDVYGYDPYVIQLVCLTIAPCFTMAGIYYLLAQLTVITSENLSNLKPMQYSLIFIIADVVSILIQAAGGGIAAGSSDESGNRLGANIMVGGIGVQVFSMAVFQLLWFTFLYKLYKIKQNNQQFEKLNPKYEYIRNSTLFKFIPYAISFSVLFVFVRSIYRLIELAQGWNGKLAITEIYFFTLESLMMCLATLCLTLCYPGMAYGRNGLKIVVEKGLKNSLSFKKKKKNVVDVYTEEVTFNERDPDHYIKMKTLRGTPL